MFFNNKAEGMGEYNFKTKFINRDELTLGVLIDKQGNEFEGEQRAGRLHGNVIFFNSK